jgi:hypothetical protein
MGERGRGDGGREEEWEGVGEERKSRTFTRGEENILAIS